MPMRKPTSAAKRAPTIIPTMRRTGPESTFRLSATAAVTPVKAPTLIKPAWPRESSPSTPTVRFREMAITT